MSPTILNVTISKTAQGNKDYMQIMDDTLGTNIVLIADGITVVDHRSGPPKKERKERKRK